MPILSQLINEAIGFGFDTLGDFLDRRRENKQDKKAAVALRDFLNEINTRQREINTRQRLAGQLMQGEFGIPGVGTLTGQRVLPTSPMAQSGILSRSILRQL